MSAFELDPRLATESLPVATLDLSELRLMDDARWPWLLLVPQVAGARELIDLEPAQQQRLLGEIDRCSRLLKAGFAPDKLNVAALGNVVPQLHVHLIARHLDDPAWPRPVWGVGKAERYSLAQAQAQIASLRTALAADG